MIKWVDLKQFLYWLVAYIPVISLLILKYLRSTLKNILEVSFFNFKINILGDFSIYMIVCLLTISFYYLGAKIFEYTKMKALKKTKGNKTIIVRSYEPISINEYSFFILSLLLPFVTEDPSDLLNLLVMLTLIFIIIIIMIKKRQIIINPIFLFSKLKVFRITGEIDGIRKELFSITKSTDFISEENTSYQFVNFDSSFNDVIFIAEKKRKN